MAKNWSQAGKSFCEAGNLQAKAGNRHDAATNYVDASNCYKKSDTNEAVSCLVKAIEIYADMGRFQIAAKHHQAIAEIYETDPTELVSNVLLWMQAFRTICNLLQSVCCLISLQKRAMQHYEQAADYFTGEESKSSANKCMLKVAQYAAHLEDYTKAIQIYEQVRLCLAHFGPFALLVGPYFSLIACKHY